MTMTIIIMIGDIIQDKTTEYCTPGQEITKNSVTLKGQI